MVCDVVEKGNHWKPIKNSLKKLRLWFWIMGKHKLYIFKLSMQTFFVCSLYDVLCVHQEGDHSSSQLDLFIKIEMLCALTSNHFYVDDCLAVFSVKLTLKLLLITAVCCLLSVVVCEFLVSFLCQRFCQYCFTLAPSSYVHLFFVFSSSASSTRFNVYFFDQFTSRSNIILFFFRFYDPVQSEKTFNLKLSVY